MILFELEAEGLKKIGLLWQLLMTDNLNEDSILIWDEPEANLHPKFLPKIVECLLELSRHGVQIFLSTHNYIYDSWNFCMFSKRGLSKQKIYCFIVEAKLGSFTLRN